MEKNTNEFILMHFRQRKANLSLASKRLQRLKRNKMKREERKMFKKELVLLIDELKQKNQNLNETITIEKKTKEKYFEMWRGSEKEKD